MNLQPVLRRRAFLPRRRRKALPSRSAVLSPPLPQHLLSKLLVVGAFRASPRVAMLHPRSSFLPIPLPQPLGLPVAHPQQSTGIHDPQLLAAHSSQHFHSSQLPLAHLRSPQSDLLSEVLLRGHFYRGQKGTLSPRDNTRGSHADEPHAGGAISGKPSGHEPCPEFLTGAVRSGQRMGKRAIGETPIA